MSARETLQLWFAAFADGDMGRARELWWDGATVHAPSDRFTGDFDLFLDWYARRRTSEGPGFSWQVIDLLGGDRYAAAVIRLVSDARPGGWDQHALYAITEDRIREIWLHETQDPA